MSLFTRIATRYAAKVQRPAMIKAVKEAFFQSGGNPRLLHQDRTPAATPVLAFWWPERAVAHFDWNRFEQLLQKQGIRIKERKANAVKVEYPLTKEKAPRGTSSVPEGAVGYILAGVLADAYPRKRPNESPTLLVHGIWADERGGTVGDKTICNKIKLDRMSDVYQPGDPICKACAARIRRLRLPHLTQFEMTI